VSEYAHVYVYVYVYVHVYVCGSADGGDFVGSIAVMDTLPPLL